MDNKFFWLAAVGVIYLTKRKGNIKPLPPVDPEDPDPVNPIPDPIIPASPYDLDLLDGYLDSQNRIHLTIRNNRIDTTLDPDNIEEGARGWVIEFVHYYLLDKPQNGVMEKKVSSGSDHVPLPPRGQTAQVTTAWPQWGNVAKRLVDDGYISGRYSFTGKILVYPEHNPSVGIYYGGGQYGNYRPVLVDPTGLDLRRA
jgi:hypothetical protein